MSIITDFLSRWFSQDEIKELEQYPSRVFNDDVYNHELGTDETFDDNYHDYADDDGDGGEDDQSDYEDELEPSCDDEGCDDGLYIDPTQYNHDLHMRYIEDDGISNEDSEYGY